MSVMSTISYEIHEILNEMARNDKDNTIKHQWKTIYIENKNYYRESCVESGIEYGKNCGYAQGYMRYTNNQIIEYCYIDTCSEDKFNEYIADNPLLNYTLLYDEDIDFLASPYNYME